MRRIMPPVLGLLCCLLAFTPVLACLWDYDTLLVERERFPETLELITGKFLRHSEAFYRWRIKDRTAKLAADPNKVEYYDDLAVAHQKVGESAKAIEVILQKELTKPGLYETYSNLGTFYILDGGFAKGIPYIEKAIAINSDAHFGREIYQLHLVKYALTKMEAGKLTFPLDPDHKRRGGPEGFSGYLSTNAKNDWNADRAIKAVLGMMRFANHRNPLLLEALGDLLLSGTRGDAKQLAARAYLQASYQMTDDISRAAYRHLAKRALSMQTTGPGSYAQLPFETVEAQFKSEQAEADAWYTKVEADEKEWVASGGDADALFTAKYYAAPATSHPIGDTVKTYLPIPPLIAFLMVAAIALLVVNRIRQRRAAQ